jgi:hypothetical protein
MPEELGVPYIFFHFYRHPLKKIISGYRYTSATAAAACYCYIYIYILIPFNSIAVYDIVVQVSHGGIRRVVQETVTIP